MNKYMVNLPVKPYIKRFLELNYGNPVELNTDKKLYGIFRKKLMKPSFRYDKNRYADLSSYFSQNIEIVISEDDFYRYGWSLSNTDIVAFNREIEYNIKFFMKNIISAYCSYMSFTKAVLLFQETYGFTEDIWSYESIKKEYQRKGLKMNFDFKKEIVEKIEKIILVNLSEKGTISQKTIQYYETN